MDWSECPLVEMLPDRLNNRPVIKNSRVAADTVVECAELGETPQEIASYYRLKLADVKALLAFAAKHQTASPVA